MLGVATSNRCKVVDGIQCKFLYLNNDISFNHCYRRREVSSKIKYKLIGMEHIATLLVLKMVAR